MNVTFGSYPSRGCSVAICDTTRSTTITSRIFSPSTTEVASVVHEPFLRLTLPATWVYALSHERIPSRRYFSVRDTAYPPTGGRDKGAITGIISSTGVLM